ncbi:MAG: hypothetical protein IMW94_01595 [Thermoanaerobacter sp.]|nr:hypothetical protein [Thermoanaerobacter sp.]
MSMVQTLSPAHCDLDCLCKTCRHDEEGECQEGTCQEAKAQGKCPITSCEDYSEK